MEDISHADLIRWRLRRTAETIERSLSLCSRVAGTLARTQELCRTTPARLVAVRLSRSSRMRPRDANLALLVRLTDPRIAAVFSDLMCMAEAITDDPDEVARLVMLRVRRDPQLITLLHDTPRDRARPTVAEARAQDQLPACRLALWGSFPVRSRWSM